MEEDNIVVLESCLPRSIVTEHQYKLMVLTAVFIVLATLFAFIGKSGAQVQSEGKYAEFLPIEQKSTNGSVYRLPIIDNMEMVQMTEQLNQPDLNQIKPMPFKFGQEIPLPLDMNTPGDGEWIVDLEQGLRFWRFTVISEGAHALALYFSDFYLATGTELYFYGSDPSVKRGAFTGSVNNRPSRKFATAPIPGESITVVYFEPINLPQDIEKSSLILSHAVHSFRDVQELTKGTEAAGACTVNVSCPPGLSKVKMIFYPKFTSFINF